MSFSGRCHEATSLIIGRDDAMSRQTKLDLAESIWKKISAQLESEKNRIYEAIKNYPPPITACDEQFDYLLEQRETIFQELARVQEISDASLREEDPARLIEEFIRTSSYVDDEAEQEIRSSMREGFSNLRS